MAIHEDDWSEEEYQSEVKLAERFDVIEFEEGAPADYYAGLEEIESDPSYDLYMSDVEMGRYDDDPSPYAGDYSEM